MKELPAVASATILSFNTASFEAFVIQCFKLAFIAYFLLHRRCFTTIIDNQFNRWYFPFRDIKKWSTDRLTTLIENHFEIVESIQRADENALIISLLFHEKKPVKKLAQSNLLKLDTFTIYRFVCYFNNDSAVEDVFDLIGFFNENKFLRCHQSPLI